MKFLLISLVALVVAGGATAAVIFGGGSSASTPEGAAKRMTAAVAKGDAVTFMNGLPPDKLAEAKSGWEKFRSSPTTDEEKAQFAQMVTMMTGANAEQNIFDMMKPKLASAQNDLKEGVNTFDTAMTGLLHNLMQQASTATPKEKEEAQKVVTAVISWLRSLNLINETKLKKAIGIAVATFKKANVTSLDQLKKLSFDEMLGKAGIVFLGVDEILASYGLPLRESIAGMKFSNAAITGDKAQVPYEFTMLDQTITGMAKMKKVDGKWVGDE